MESNNLISAPYVPDVTALLAFWKESHTGSIDDFYSFMATPTVERDDFLASCREDIGLIGEVAIVSYSPL